ncbi:hypothetical protein BGW36DRAFT_432552 [Talaromyces proteolyticus]|uniref:Uncharacterized protein n=1 Tax=Talaromyces proteolyticus TaxID=1131652 RepID=A0AAD4KF26_9EURO|nr:uncharacterized protein BGW36DRAFT_432552 [Talaromyces proteolyticus]KAH8690764.1 hypothetical protein BGW36DRAFT_432552 [Talaromyces proteolyticus]
MPTEFLSRRLQHAVRTSGSTGLVLLELSTTCLQSRPGQTPKKQLAITLDYPLAAAWPKGTTSRDPRNFLWSSHITFNAPVSHITDGQLWQLAFDDYYYIGDDLERYSLDPETKYPLSLKVLAWGNGTILASGQKGDNSFTYAGPRSEVRLSLERCQTTYLKQRKDSTAKEHRRRGKCAEQMAAHLYYLSPTTTTNLPAQNARIGAVVYDPRTGVVFKARPCGNNPEDDWGCNLFVKDQNLRTLSTNIPAQPYSLDNLAGGGVQEGSDPTVWVNQKLLNSVDDFLLKNTGLGGTGAAPTYNTLMYVNRSDKFKSRISANSRGFALLKILIELGST